VALLAVFIGAPSYCFAQTTSSKDNSGSTKASASVNDDDSTSSVPDARAGNPSTPDPGTGNPPPGQTTSKTGPVPGTAPTGRFGEFVRNAPIRDSFVTVDLAGKYVKGVVGGFQQGASLGFGLQFSTADLIKPVEFRAWLLTSTFWYRRFEGEAYIPKVFSSNTHADLWFDYLFRREDNFFGIGPTTPHTSQTDFALEQRSFNATLYHNFTRHFQVGGYVSVVNSSTYPGESDVKIPSTDVFSGNPNVVPITLWAPGLQQNTKILFYGGFAEWDLRNNNVGLTRGAYFYARVGSAQGLEENHVFSDYGWLEGAFDVRGYIPLGSHSTSLALRGAAWLEGPRGGSQIPFYDLAILGGRLYNPGFQNYRFRANNLVLFQAELRQTVWRQREDRGFDIFGSGAVGQVWGDNRSKTNPVVLNNNEFDSSFWRSAIGGGVQYRYNRNFAARIEVAHSNERTLVLGSVTRGF
jgi:hypothetical protein